MKTKLNNTLILGATAWVVVGAIYHVLEDTDLLLPALQYFFITPPIYLLFGAFGIVSFLVGTYMERIAAKTGVERALQKLWLLQSIILLVYTLAWAMEWSKIVAYVSPLHVALFSVINHFLVRFRVQRKGLDARDLVWMMTIMPMLVALDYVWLYSTDPWTPYGGDGMVSAIFLAPALAGAAAGIVWVFGRAMLKKGKEWGAAFTSPINLVLVFSQMVDGFATALGIDINHYSEKHVLSARVIDAFRDFSENIGWGFGAEYPTFLAFVPLKFLVSILVIVAIDIYSKEDVKKYPTLIGLVKFAIIMVGIGPGVRDFVRLAMGV